MYLRYDKSVCGAARVSEQDNDGVVDLSIIVVSWNTRDLLERCLASVNESLDARFFHAENRLSYEVIVVDNFSTDGTSEMVRERFPLAELTERSENGGFARANNEALRRYHGRYALLLNPDTEVQPGALSMLVTFMDQHPAAGAAGPRLLNPDGSLQPSCFPSPGLAREFWRLFHADAIHHYGTCAMSEWKFDEVRPVDIVQGACLILRRETLDQVGLFDEDFYIYSEEVDLCQRIRQGGWKIYFVPQAQVVHFGGQSTRQVAERMFLQLYRSKILYFRKHKGPLSALAYKGILLLASCARLALGPVAIVRHPRKRQELALVARYYCRLIVELGGM